MPQNAFEFFLGRENARLVQLLERNHDVSAVIQGILENAVEYCNHKGLEFERLRLKEGHVIPTDDGDALIRVIFTHT